MGLAWSDSDNCEVNDIWTGNTFKYNGGQVHNVANITAHSHSAFKVKCLPF